MADGAIFVFSVTYRSDFDRLPEIFDGYLGNMKIPVVIAGNQCDLTDERKVSTQEGRDFAEERGCTYIETSAKMNVNVEEAFITLCHSILNDNPDNPVSVEKDKRKCVIS